MNPLYTRHFALKEFAENEQQRLTDAKVLIVGLGGLGHLVATYLTTAGIGEILLNDFDTIDETNLQRQFLYSQDDVGKNKAEIAKEKLTKLNNEVALETITNRLSESELIKKTKNISLIIDCSDNFGTRFTLNSVSQKNKIPLVSGAAIRFEGQITVFDPSDSDNPCYHCLFEESDELAEDCAGNGVLAPVTGVIASSMSIEAIKVLTGIGSALVGRLHLFDGKAGTWREVRYQKDHSCKVCN